MLLRDSYVQLAVNNKPEMNEDERKEIFSAMKNTTHSISLRGRRMPREKD
jgi:hypothetical protein